MRAACNVCGMLSDGPAPKLLLLVAPAGFGKTTAAATLARARPETFVIENAHLRGDLDEVLRRLWTDWPNARAVLCARQPLNVAFSLAQPHERRLVRAEELRITTAELTEFFSAFRAAPEQIARLYAATLGWPAAVFVALERARRSGVAAALDDVSALVDRPLAKYIDNEVLPSLSAQARLLLLLASFEPLEIAEIDMLLGKQREKALEEVEGSFLIRTHDDERYKLHPLLKTAIGSRRHGEASAAAGSLASVYERARQPMRAARWYLRAGDTAAANAAYNQQTFAQIEAVTSDDATAAAATLDERALVENLAIFNVAAVEQLFIHDYERWFAMAEEALRRAPDEVPSEVRAFAINMLVSRYAYFGRFDDARRVLNAQSARLGSQPEYQQVLTLCDAFVRGTHDEFIDLTDLRVRLNAMLLDPYGRAAFASLAAYVYGVQGDWPAARVELEVMIDTLTHAKQDMHLEAALMGGAFFAWLYGDDERFGEWFGRHEQLAATDDGAFFTRCVREAQFPVTGECSVAVVCFSSYLIASAARDADTARRYARLALVEGRRTHRPFNCTLAHLALGLLNPEDAQRHFADAGAAAANVGWPRVGAAVAAVVAGDEDAGMLSAFRAHYEPGPITLTSR